MHEGKSGQGSFQKCRDPIGILRTYGFEGLFLFEPFIRSYRKLCSESLEYQHEHDKQNDRRKHYKVLVSVVSVVDRDLSETAASDDSAHGAVSEYGYHGDGGV